MVQDSPRHLEDASFVSQLAFFLHCADPLWTAPNPYARVTGHDPHGHGPQASSQGHQKNYRRGRKSQGCCLSNEPSSEAGHFGSVRTVGTIAAMANPMRGHPCHGP